MDEKHRDTGTLCLSVTLLLCVKEPRTRTINSYENHICCRGEAEFHEGRAVLPGA